MKKMACDDHQLLEIVSSCLSADEACCNVYANLGKAARGKQLKTFWENMAKEEKSHVDFWKYVVTLAGDGILPQVFSSPQSVKSELIPLQKRVKELLESSRTTSDTTAAFLIAYRLEFCLLHPAFTTLFHFVRSFDDRENPADGYESHIKVLVDSLARFGTVTAELELLGECFQRLWKENQSLFVQSSVDELTGILNRRGFFNIIRPLSHLAQRNDYQIGIVMVDIDHLNKINDRFGYEKGDQALREVATTLKNNVRASDVVGRYGGEEFIIYFSSTNPGSLNIIADKLRKKVESLSAHGMDVTISLGVSSGTLNKTVDEELNTMIHKANSFLEQAKLAGRNRVVMG
jgi:diguanylate cyclase (GGDEF)-like protein